MTSLHLYTEIREGHVTVTVIGELDAHSAPSLAAFAEQIPVPTDVIDARFVSFVDAAGLRALLAARARHDSDLVPSALVSRLISISGIDVPLRSEPFGQPRLDDAAFAVALHDTDLRYRYVNERLAQLNGIPVERHLGKLPQEVFDIEVDELSDIIHDVVRRHAPASVTVELSSAAQAPGHWACDYYPVRWVSGDHVVHQVMAVVDAGSPAEDALAVRFSPSAGSGA